MSESRRLSVAHQTPGECDYCDTLYRRLQAAFWREYRDQPAGPCRECGRGRYTGHKMDCSRGR